MTTAVREPIDLRLAAGTAVGWVLLALCVGRSACTVTGVTVIVFGTGGCAFLASRHGSRGASVVAVAGFCGALVLGPFAGRLVHARAGPLMRLAAVRSAVSLSLTAAGDPRPLAAKGVGGPVRIALALPAASADDLAVEVDAELALRAVPGVAGVARTSGTGRDSPQAAQRQCPRCPSVTRS